MEHFDIAVIGAGPAGSLAAKNAAVKGRKVCLIERKPVVGTPVRCGEGIGFKGMTLAVDARQEWIKTQIANAAMISPGGIRVDIGQVGDSLILDREKMDYDLAQDAVRCGAQLLVSIPVTSIKQHGTFDYECIWPNGSLRASIVILADGVESKLARCLGWNTALKMIDIETCAFAHVVSPLIEPSTVIFYTGGKYAPGGYVWVFPRGGGTANVGLGILGSMSSPGKALDLLKKFIDKEFPASRITDLHCGGVPVAKWIRPLVKDGAMLVGDAAHQVNCMSGAGIAYALFAGKTAGAVAAESFTGQSNVNGQHLKTYEKIWEKRYGKQQIRSYSLKEFIRTADDAFLDHIAKSLVKEDPKKMNYLRVFIRAFGKHPLLLIKAIRLFR